MNSYILIHIHIHLIVQLSNITSFVVNNNRNLLSSSWSREFFFLKSNNIDEILPNKLTSYFERKNRPKYIGISNILSYLKLKYLSGIPRKRMDLPFAIQLMRSSYNTVDDLDFIPMDEFQKLFFTFRQSEWKDYIGYHKTVVQGDLADSLYFDFISYCQYAVTSFTMKRGLQEFVEKVYLS